MIYFRPHIVFSIHLFILAYPTLSIKTKALDNLINLKNTSYFQLNMKCFSFVIHHLFQISGHDHKKTAFFVEYLGLFFLNLVANGAAAVICSKAVMIQWVFKPLQSKTFNRFTGCEKGNIFSELTVFSNNMAISTRQM